MKGKLLILIEYLLLILYLIFFHSPKISFPILLITKSLLMPLLIILFLMNVRKFNTITLGIILALIASTSGDFFMELNQKNDIYFLPGLASFLLAHIFYIFSFSYKLKISQIQHKNLILLILLIVLALSLILYLWQYLEDMKIPVIIYAFVLTSLTYIAYLRCQAIYKSNCWLFWGTLLFLLSDAALSITLFRTIYPLHREINMLLYVSGQLLITISSIDIVIKSND